MHSSRTCTVHCSGCRGEGGYPSMHGAGGVYPRIHPTLPRGQNSWHTLDTRTCQFSSWITLNLEMEQTWDVRAIFHFDYHWDFLANQNSTFTFETYCVCKTRKQSNFFLLIMTAGWLAFFPFWKPTKVGKKRTTVVSIIEMIGHCSEMIVIVSLMSLFCELV